MTKLLYVSFLVQDNRLHETLLAIEPHKVGDLQVRAVAAQPQAVSNDPLRPRKLKRGAGAKLVLAEIVKGNKFSVIELVSQLGLNQKLVQSQVSRMLKAGTIKRIAYGIYTKTTKLKESPQ